MMMRRGPIPRQRRFKAIGEFLKNKRERCQLTQSDIGDLLKEKGYATIVPVTYRRWENGETSIPFEVVEILCKHFQLSAEELGLVEHRPNKGNVHEHVSSL